MVGSERCEIYLNRIWLDSAHILNSGGAECSGSNPLAKYNLCSGPSNIVVKGAECFVGLDCRFIALAGGRIQAVPEESGVFWRWRVGLRLKIGRRINAESCQCGHQLVIESALKRDKASANPLSLEASQTPFSSISAAAARRRSARSGSIDGPRIDPLFRPLNVAVLSVWIMTTPRAQIDCQRLNDWSTARIS